MNNTNHETVRREVREKYGILADRVRTGENASCCGPSCCSGDPITSDLYTADDAAVLPDTAVSASLGCGNPTALADLKAGDTVLDLGSGGGIDVLLSARRVGPTGKVFGLDMTDEMLALARDNQRKAGATNVEFLKGTIESMPLPDASVDVIISNCVINLSPDKDAALREAFRVLKPGGRFAVSDVVVLGEVSDDIRRNMELWIGCIAGALRDTEYIAKLAKAGFERIDVEPWRIYSEADAGAICGSAGVTEKGDGQFASAFVRAVKPDKGLRS